MAAKQLEKVVRQIHSLARRPPTAMDTDAALLERFRAAREESAFAALLRRHGPMVWNVCCRTLGQHADSEDAFQATFVILLRKASSIRRPAALANWLYGVAYRTALEARRARAKRRLKEATAIKPTTASHMNHDDLLAVLDEELSRLSESLRTVLVLCDLEGKTRKEAAQLLGCPEGTVLSRLSRGRARLAQGLTRRGFGATTGALVAVLAESAAAAVPSHVLAKTALVVATGTGGSLPVAALVNGVLKAMFLAKLQLMAAAALVALVIAGGGIVLLAAGAEEGDKPAAPKQPAPGASQTERPQKDQQPSVGKIIEQTLADAAKSAEDIPDPFQRVQALGRISYVQAKSGAREASRKTINLAMETAKSLSTETPRQKSERFDALKHTALLPAFTQDWSHARKLLEELSKEPDVPKAILDQTTSQFAHHQLEAGLIADAVETMQGINTNRGYFDSRCAMKCAEEKDWNRALKIAEQIEGVREQARTFAQLSIAQSKEGRTAEARTNLQRARKLLDPNKEKRSDDSLLLEVARAHFALGERTEAVRLLESMSNPSEQYPARENALATFYLELGEFSKSLEWARKAKAINELEEYPFRKIAALYAEKKEFEKALHLAEQIKDNVFHAQALMDIAAAQYRHGLKDESAQSFREAVEVAEKVSPREEPRFAFFNAASIFDKIAEVQAELGETDAARVWIGRQIAAVNRAYALAGLASGLHKRAEAAVKK